MFGVGFSEIIIIVLVALLVFGPDKLPEIARYLGRAMREVRRVNDDLQNSFHEAIYAEENKALDQVARRPPEIRPAEGTEALPLVVATVVSNPEKSASVVVPESKP